MADASVIALLNYDEHVDPHNNGGAGGIWCAVEYGQNSANAAGTVNGVNSWINVHDCGATSGSYSEMAAYMGVVSAGPSANTATDVLRLWGIDLGVQGPFNQQAQLLVGLHNVVNNYHSNATSIGALGALVMTAPGTGPCGSDNWHSGRTTYPLDVGLGICGFSNTSASRLNGFGNALQIGGALGWMQPLGGRSRFSKGIDLSDYVDYGIYIHDRHAAGSGPAIAVAAGVGNVGIGLTNPEQPLHVAKASGACIVDIDAFCATGSSPAVLQLRHSASNTLSTLAATSTGAILGAAAYYGVNSGSSAWAQGATVQAVQDGSAGASYVPGRLELLTSDGTGAPTARLYVKPDGSVGVATSSPDALLDLNKSGGPSGTNKVLRLRAGNNNSYFGNNLFLISWTGGTDYTHAIKSRHNSAAAAGNSIDFYLWKYGTDAASTVGTLAAMTLDGNGRMGLGTTSPSAKLELAGLATADLAFVDAGTSGGTTDGWIQITIGGSTKYIRVYNAK